MRSGATGVIRWAFVVLAILSVSCGGGSPTGPTRPPPAPGPTPTPDPPPAPVVYPDEVFVGAGDVGDCNTGGAIRTGRLLDGIPGTVFMLGDGGHPQGSRETYADCYAPSWGRQLWRTRPVPGNHDYDLPDSPGFFDYFAGQLGDAGRTYYDYQLGAWRIYALDSNLAAGESSSQYQWLSAHLAASPSACTLAYWHHPVRSSSRGGDQDNMLAVWRLLSAAGAEVVLSSHDHVFERFAPMNASFAFDPRGIREFVVGTGGGRHYTFRDPKPLSEARIEQTWGVLKLTLSNDGYAWTFVPIAGSAASDSGSDTCH